MHYSNLLLSSEEYENIATDQSKLRQQIDEVFEKLEHVIDTNQSIDTKLIGRCTKLVKTFKSLKYYFTDELRIRIVTVLMNAYRTGDKITISMKTRILNTVKGILKKNWSKITITLDWKFFWSEIIVYITRENRADIIGGETVLLEYIKGLISFLHDMRHYFDPYTSTTSSDDSLQGTLVECAMKKLENLQSLFCVEGVLLLSTCLPTDFNDYDTYLPQWITIWQSIDHNAGWDCCWLMIFSRAIKYSKTFDWTPLFPCLIEKTREFLYLPSDCNAKTVDFGSFPKCFPSYYKNFLVFKDIHKKIITKLMKLLFHIMVFPTKSLVSDTVSMEKHVITPDRMLLTLPITITKTLTERNLSFPGISDNVSLVVYTQANEFMLFLQTLRSFFHASNQGGFVITLGKLLFACISSISKYYGRQFATRLLLNSSSSASSESSLTSKEQELQQIEWNTIQYLMGNCMLLSIEALFTKQAATVASNYFIQSISTLIGLSPEYTHMIMPYFLLILDPNQSNLASTTMSTPQKITTIIHTISNCIHSMIYPNASILLEYLPELLRLSLIGLDPSDSMKTIYTLDLYSNIFSWLPIRNIKSYLQEYGNMSCITSYVDLLHPESHENAMKSNPNACNTAQYQVYIEQLIGYVIPSNEEMSSISGTNGQSNVVITSNCWLFQLFDKLCNLITHLEQKIKGARQSHTIPAVSQSLGYILQAIHPDEVELKYVMENKLLQYITTSAPSHTSKICGKIIESIVYNHPERLLEIVESHIKIRDLLLVTNTTTSTTGLSNERIAFLLILIGGSCRNSQSKAILTILPLLQEVIFNQLSYFVHHEEVKIRKAIGKCLKDILKGMTSVYPIHVYPHYYHTQDGNTTTNALLGQPNIPSESQLKWHVPSSDILITLQPIIAKITTTIETEIAHSLEQINKESKVVSSKKYEETIGNNLALLRRIIRGLADLLPAGPLSLETDSTAATTTATSESVEESSSSNDDSLPQKSNQFVPTTVHTGREKILQELQLKAAPEIVNYYLMYRYDRITFLTNIHDCITGYTPASAPAVPVFTDSMMITGEETTVAPVTTTTPTAALIGGLQNNAFIAKQWMKNVTLLLTRYVACLKDIDNIAKYLSFHKQKEDHIMYRTIHDILLQHFHETTAAKTTTSSCWGGENRLQTLNMSPFLLGTSGNPVTQSISSGRGFFSRSEYQSLVTIFQQTNYWKFHNLNTNNLMNRVWLQHSIRCHVYALQTMKQYVFILAGKDENYLQDYRSFLSSGPGVSETGPSRRNSKIHDYQIPYTKSIYQILEYARHDFDHIRPIGRKYFDKLSCSLGYQSIYLIFSFFTYIESLGKLVTSGVVTTTSAAGALTGNVIGTGEETGVTVKRETNIANVWANQISSLYVICKHTHIMKRIGHHTLLKEIFLHSMMTIQHSILDQITEIEKREKLVLSLTDTYIKYTSYWHHADIQPEFFYSASSKEEKESKKVLHLYDRIVGEALQAFGLTKGGESQVAAGAFYDTNTLKSITSNGLRFDTFYAYNLFHVLDKSLLILSSEYTWLIWQFILQQLITQHNQPSQLIALSMFLRLIENIRLSVTFSNVTNEKSLQFRELIVSSPWYSALQTLFNPLKPNKDTTIVTGSSEISDLWKGIYIGLIRSHAHVNAEEGHPTASGGNRGNGNKSQWADGIDHILSASDFLSLVISRYVISKRYEANICSTYVRRKMIVFFEGLLVSNLLLQFPVQYTDYQQDTTTRFVETPEMLALNQQKLTALLTGLTQLPVAGNESESRVMNCIRAEIWSGLLRGFLALQSSYGMEITSYEEILLSYFIPWFESISIEYAKDWQESIHFAYESYPLPISMKEGNQNGIDSPIVKYILSAFQSALLVPVSSTAAAAAATTIVLMEEEDKQVIEEIVIQEVEAVSANTNDEMETETSPVPEITTLKTTTTVTTNMTTTATTTLDEGFARPGKMIMLMSGLLLGNNIAHSIHDPKKYCPMHRIPEKDKTRLPVAEALLTLLTSSEYTLQLSYRFCRMEISNLLVILFEYCQFQFPEQLHLFLRTKFLTPSSTSNNNKNIIETVMHMITKLLQRLTVIQATPYVQELFPILLEGVIHTESEVVKHSTETILYIFNNLVAEDIVHPHNYHDWLLIVKQYVLPTSASTTAVTASVAVPGTEVNSNLWRQKEVLINGMILIMVQHWIRLTNEEKIILKEILQNGMNQDENMHVQEIASTGMIIYLSYKSAKELQKIAEIYLRNSETLATREKQKRRQQSTTTTATTAATVVASTRPDNQYLTIIQMIGCVISVTPYDLPVYLPPLISSFLRHNNQYDQLKSIITKTMKLFKRTHQDCWEDFKTLFNNEQLSDLQGVGAAHYYT